MAFSFWSLESKCFKSHFVVEPQQGSSPWIPTEPETSDEDDDRDVIVPADKAEYNDRRCRLKFLVWLWRRWRIVNWLLKELLRMLNIHVVGAASEHLQDEVVPLYDQDGNLELVVAAVPFLRDRDLRFSQAGEGSYERLQRVREGMQCLLAFSPTHRNQP